MDAVSGEGIASVREAGSAVAKFFLEESAESSGEEVGGGVGVAELNDADELSCGIGLELVKLIKEGMKGAGVFDADARTGERVHDAVGDGFAAAERDGWCGSE
jgi:hypothetical protein